jgi:hypothetical protein
MNLNNLKPAWKQFLLINSMQPVDQNEILSIIARADRQTIGRLPRVMASTVLFIVLTISCQAG